MDRVNRLVSDNNSISMILGPSLGRPRVTMKRLSLSVASLQCSLVRAWFGFLARYLLPPKRAAAVFCIVVENFVTIQATVIIIFLALETNKCDFSRAVDETGQRCLVHRQHEQCRRSGRSND